MKRGNIRVSFTSAVCLFSPFQLFKDIFLKTVWTINYFNFEVSMFFLYFQTMSESADCLLSSTILSSII